MYDNDMNEQKLFALIFEHFQNKYGHANLEMVNPYGPKRTIVSMNGEMIFNTDGYNLLYNLTRLCDALKEELR